MNRFRKSPFPEPIPNSPTLPTSLPSPTIAANELDAVREFVSTARAASTTDAYHRDFSAFERWCRTRSHSSLPARPETLAAYLACEATRGIRPSTLARRAAAVASMHRLAGHVSPTESQLVCLTLAGIRRARGTAPVRKTPIGTEAIKAIFAATPDTIAGFRDRALVLLGFAGALRRSKLVALDVDDLQEAFDRRVGRDLRTD
jgi:site-specific recombinase XerD